jgi:Ethanolamine utilization protein EutJ (predicted chaperonin)
MLSVFGSPLCRVVDWVHFDYDGVIVDYLGVVQISAAG